MARGFKLTYSMVLLCCLFCGAAAGTVLTNCLGRELIGQLGYISIELKNGLSMSQRRALWGFVARQRLAEFGLAALAGMTPFAAGCFAFLSFTAGVCCGLAVSVITLEKGVMGLPYYLLSLFPQGVLYLPVWAFMAVRAEKGLDRLRLRTWIFLTVLAGAGTLLEAYINPLFLRF